MSRTDLAELDLVVHLFAPTDGPDADRARDQLLSLWHACVESFDLRTPVDGLGDDVAAVADNGFADGRVAARQDADRRDQVVARHVTHDALGLSVLLSGPDSAQLAQRWESVAAAAPRDALLGTALLFYTTLSAEIAEDRTAELRRLVRELAPPPFGVPGDGVAFPMATMWEAPGPDAAPERTFFLVTNAEHDPDASGFAWWGDARSAAPLARYLVTAAKIRHQARLWDHGAHTARLRRRADHALDSGDPLHTTESDIALTGSRLTEMGRTVRIARDNLVRHLGSPDAVAPHTGFVAADLGLADWLLEAIDDDLAYLVPLGERVRHAREAETTRPAPPRRPNARLTPRLGVTVDVVGYGRRPAREREHLTTRVMTLFHAVIDRIGPVEGQIREGEGDGGFAFMPVGADPAEAVQELLSTTRLLLARDNAAHSDRMQLRMALDFGLVGQTADAIAGPLIVHLRRLGDCAAIRAAVADNPASPLVVLLSDWLHTQVVLSGYLAPEFVFHRVEVREKELTTDAWVWCAPGGPTNGPRCTGSGVRIARSRASSAAWPALRPVSPRRPRRSGAP